MSFDYESQKKTLFLVSEILEKNHFKKKCNMGFGLFLGCIRSGNLNTKNNDWDDLDFNVLDENWEELVEIIIPDLLASGFDILHSFENTHGDISEITIGYGKDRIDFHKNYKLKTGYLHYAWHGGMELGKILKSQYFENIRSYKLENVKLYGPENSEEYLLDLYGEGWRIPCKSENEYKFWEDSPGIPWSFRKQGEKILRGVYKK